MNIPKRQDVMTRISKDEVFAVNAACEKVAKLLNEAVALPVIVEMEVLGPTNLIREKVAVRIGEAGWRVEREDPEKNTNYSIR